MAAPSVTALTAYYAPLNQLCSITPRSINEARVSGLSRAQAAPSANSRLDPRAVRLPLVSEPYSKSHQLIGYNICSDHSCRSPRTALGPCYLLY